MTSKNLQLVSNTFYLALLFLLVGCGVSDVVSKKRYAYETLDGYRIQLKEIGHITYSHSQLSEKRSVLKISNGSIVVILNKQLFVETNYYGQLCSGDIVLVSNDLVMVNGEALEKRKFDGDARYVISPKKKRYIKIGDYNIEINATSSITTVDPLFGRRYLIVAGKKVTVDKAGVICVDKKTIGASQKYSLEEDFGVFSRRMNLPPPQ